MKISILIPVHNEKSTISEIISRIQSVDIDKEIIITDDKSTDGTSEILRKDFSNKEGIKLIFLDRNRGKGFAVRRALLEAIGEIVIVQDADLEYDPNDYKRLIRPIIDGNADVVYGSRFMDLAVWPYIRSWFASWFKGKECGSGHLYLSHFFGIQILNLLVRLLYGAKLTDEATCYKVFKKDVLWNIKLRARRFEFCPEVTAKACKAGYSIYEIPISYYPRTTEHGKKIGWRDGFAAIYTLIKYRFIN